MSAHQLFEILDLPLNNILQQRALKRNDMQGFINRGYFFHFPNFSYKMKGSAVFKIAEIWKFHSIIVN